MAELCAWDVDGTIRPGFLFGEAVAHAAGEGIIDGDRIGDVSNPTWPEVRYFFESLQGVPVNKFAGLVQRVEEEATDRAYPWAIEMMLGQVDAGNHVVLFSTSPDFLVRAFGRGLGSKRVSHARGSWYHTRDGVFSGRAVTLDKVRAAKRCIREHRLSGFLFAAGDSLPDTYLLHRANRGLLVNPTGELTVAAAQHSWEVVNTEETIES